MGETSRVIHSHNLVKYFYTLLLFYFIAIKSFLIIRFSSLVSREFLKVGILLSFGNQETNSE